MAVSTNDIQISNSSNQKKYSFTIYLHIASLISEEVYYELQLQVPWAICKLINIWFVFVLFGLSAKITTITCLRIQESGQQPTLV
jgi:hypothetical protein